MSMKDTLLANLSGSLAFDSVLKSNSAVDRITARYLQAVLFERDDVARAAAIEKMQAEIIEHFAKVLQPAARKLGTSNAADVVAVVVKGGGTIAPADPDLTRQALASLNIKTADRIDILSLAIDDKGNTLGNRLAMFWKEPGGTPADKAKLLAEKHKEQEEARHAWELATAKFDQGEGTRPRKPTLEYLSGFTAESKKELRIQARRTSTDTEQAVFQARGVKRFAWVAVNAGDACPDCRKLNGSRGTMSDFERTGKPGDGRTVCGASCFCLLVPEETVRVAPDLADGLNLPGSEK